MNKKRPMYRRVIAAVLALAILGFGAFITDSFVGNPISGYFAGKKMEKYVKDKYPDMNLTLSKTIYNFKLSGYTLQASMPGSPDTHFTVICRKAGRISDGYKDYVLSGFNTLDRLGREMAEEIKPLLDDLFGDQLSDRLFVDCFGKNKDLAVAPPPDTPFNRNMKLDAMIYLNFDIENPTLEDIAQKIQKAHGLLQKEGFSIGGYMIEAINRETKKGYMARVDTEMIDGDLAKAMKNVLDSNNPDDRLYVISMK